MNWVDISVIIILAISSITGFYQGFVLSVFNLAGVILSYIIARLYYPLIAQFILNNQNLYEKIRGFVDRGIYSIFEDKLNTFEPSPMLEGLRLPKPLIDNISKSPQLNTYVSEFSDAMLNTMSEALTRIFIDVISLIIAFIIVRIGMIVILRFLNIFTELPLIKQFNKLLGFSFGFIKGLLIILIIFAILTPIISISPEGFLSKGVFESNIGYYLYHNNILLKYLKDIIF